jgi:hypothetical protein
MGASMTSSVPRYRGNTEQAPRPVDLDDTRDDVPAGFDQRDLDDRRAERHDLAS